MKTALKATIVEGTMHSKKRSGKRKQGYYPEKIIDMLIWSGAIASAGKNAIAASFKKGLSVTVLENGIIYRLHPDGSRTAIKKVRGAAKVYSTGKMLIK